MREREIEQETEIVCQEWVLKTRHVEWKKSLIGRKREIKEREKRELIVWKKGLRNITDKKYTPIERHEKSVWNWNDNNTN